MLRYYFTIAHDLVFDYIFCDLIFLWSCPLYDVRWIWSFFLKFIYSADCLHLLTSWSEVDYLLCFPFLCGLIIVNSLTLQRNSRRFFPPRNASPLLKSLMRLSFSLSLSLRWAYEEIFVAILRDLSCCFSLLSDSNTILHVRCKNVHRRQICFCYTEFQERLDSLKAIGGPIFFRFIPHFNFFSLS